jgi:hypothetical protein
METFRYCPMKSKPGEGIPWVLEAAFAWCPNTLEGRRLISGVNWSPAIINPFRRLGWRASLDSLLEDQRAGAGEPIALMLHLACPRVRYTDPGKSAIVLWD